MELFNFKKQHNFNLDKNNDCKTDPYINIGNIVKDSRIKRNLSVKDLSKISKIPISTIVSIENNIKESLPKYPFTRSILLKLEECLFIEKFKLINLAKEQSHYHKKTIKKSYLFNTFDLFNSWQGGIIYLLLIVISIFMLNSYYLENRVIEFKYIEKQNK